MQQKLSEYYICSAENKFVCVIGDSVMRLVYKDLLMMITEDRLLTYSELCNRGEMSFLGDILV